MWIELLDTTTAAEIPVSKLLQPPAMEAPRARKNASAQDAEFSLFLLFIGLWVILVCG